MEIAKLRQYRGTGETYGQYEKVFGELSAILSYLKDPKQFVAEFSKSITIIENDNELFKFKFIGQIFYLTFDLKIIETNEWSITYAVGEVGLWKENRSKVADELVLKFDIEKDGSIPEFDIQRGTPLFGKSHRESTFMQCLLFAITLHCERKLI